MLSAGCGDHVLPAAASGPEGTHAMSSGASPSFGDLLRQHRRAAELTQEELAARAGLSARGINDLERGARRTPRRDTVALLADALHLVGDEHAAFEAAARHRPTPDLSHPTRTHRVRSEGVADNEAPGERMDARPCLSVDHSLPIQLTSFVGRRHEMAEIGSLLASARLVTLTGAGGSGKTRLAIEAAAALRERFPGGVWMVELAALTDPHLVADTVARALEIRQDSGVLVLQALVDHLRSRRLLIVLDNCEHLILACAQLVELLLGACPHVRILATSREALRIPGEVVWLVPPLSRPVPHPLLLLQDLMRYEAVALFLERAQTVSPTFMVSGQDVQAVAELCARLDGLPLAIEMAAARVKMLTVGEIVERLDGSFRLLAAGSRTVSPRQQTLKATLDWSHNLLAPAEQALFRGLAVFAGGFTLRAAEQVAWGAHEDATQALDLLTSLAEKSLVVPGGDHTDEMRCRLLEPIRQYALHYLETSGEAIAVQERHAQFFLAFAEAAEAYLETPNQAVWLERLERDHDNLRAALRWFASRREIACGLRLASALWMFWFIRGYVPEGRERFAELLALAGDGVPAAVCASALNNAGFLGRYASDYASARPLIAESLRIRRELGDVKGTADSMANLGYVTLQLGDYTAACAAYQESLELNRTVGNGQGIADALSHLAIAAAYKNDLAHARALNEESLALWRELGDGQGVSWALHQLGNIILRQGENEAAQAIFKESLRIARSLGLRWGIAWSLEDAARLAALQGLPGRALRLAGCAASLRRRIGMPLPPRERAEFDATLVPSRHALGETASAAAWAEGEAMAVEQVVDDMLG